MSNLSQNQLDVIDLYGLIVRDEIEDEIDGGIAVCELSHPSGVVDLYIYQRGSIYVEEGDDLDGFDLVPVEDSSLAGLFVDYRNCDVNKGL